jgi:glycosyltransferase involved in cell wall biosynthesis
MKSALFICDPSWSTGNIAKCLNAVLPNWLVDLHNWREPFSDNVWYDAVVGMSMTGPARNPSWRTPRMASVLCGPGEMLLPEVAALELPAGCVLAGVSSECANLLRTAYPSVDSVHTTPGFPHPRIFTWREPTVGPIRRAGFVGFSVAQNMQVSGLAKRPEMFRAICALASVEAVFSEQRYRYEDMQEFYDSVDVVISTSAHEGGPFSPLEAVACGVPALSTDVGVIHDMALPGIFTTIEECAAMIPQAKALLAAQRIAVAEHTRRAIHDWERFLSRAAQVRAL